jgi:alkylation response protein AidB-like acyl-CoA dehydrogenase
MAISMPAIATFWNHPAKEGVVERIILGTQRSCLAISEPHAGSDVANIVTFAKKSKCGKFYIVNGIKKWITAGMNADLFSVAVRTGLAGAGGISFLLVDKNDPKTAEVPFSTDINMCVPPVPRLPAVSVYSFSNTKLSF